MEKFVYDHAIEDVLDIINSRIEYYDCLIMADNVDMVEFEIIEELETLKDMIEKIKYY